MVSDKRDVAWAFPPHLCWQDGIAILTND